MNPFRRSTHGDDDTEWLSQITTSPADGTTVQFTGASIIGLPDDVTAIAIAPAGCVTTAGYVPAPPAFPALQAAPEPRPVLAEVPVTERAVIGDELRLPIIWCEMPQCINHHLDREAAGERDARTRAHDAGWRTDALGRLACPGCQQTRADYRTPQTVTWHHPDVARHWHERGIAISEEDAFRLSVEAELGRRVSHEDPALTGAIAGATYRHHKAVTS